MASIFLIGHLTDICLRFISPIVLFRVCSKVQILQSGMILEIVKFKFWHSRVVICDVDKPEVIWDLVGETFMFSQWCLLVMLVHLSLGHRFLMNLGEWVLLPIVVFVAGSLVRLYTCAILGDNKMRIKGLPLL